MAARAGRSIQPRRREDRVNFDRPFPLLNPPPAAPRLSGRKNYLLRLEVQHAFRRNNECRPIVVLFEGKTEIKPILRGDPKNYWFAAKITFPSLLSGSFSRAIPSLDEGGKRRSKSRIKVAFNLKCRLASSKVRSRIPDGLQKLPTKIYRNDVVYMPPHRASHRLKGQIVAYETKYVSAPRISKITTKPNQRTAA